MLLIFPPKMKSEDDYATVRIPRELAKIADSPAKPILHTFYVLDGPTTKYEYAIITKT